MVRAGNDVWILARKVQIRIWMGSILIVVFNGTNRNLLISIAALKAAICSGVMLSGILNHAKF
jgi:hypothetical protein